MQKNRKQKLLVFFLLFLIVIGAIYFHRYSNRPRNLNVLLITLDGLRSDHLGCYGYRRNTSPNIDKLAKEGVLFTQAISQTSWTCSLASLLTSTYPSTNKIEGFGFSLDGRLLTLAEILKKKNYFTACVSGGDWIYKDFPDLGRGFNYFFNAQKVDTLVEQVMKWIISFQNKKFFIWIHFFDYPHAPYNPPYPFNRLFISNNKSKQIPIGKDTFGMIPEWVAVNNITDIDYYISQYDGEITYVDEQIGKILDELKNLNLDKNTIIIISADHGESLGEHNYYFQHGYYLFDQLLKVPLIFKGPKIPKGMVINQQVRLIDVVPTILSLLGIRVNSNMEGVSLLPIISGKDNNVLYAFSEVWDREGLNLKSIRTTEWKLIHNLNTDKYELYNLKMDTTETINLAETEKNQLKFLKAKLQAWRTRAKPDITPSSKPLDKEAKERLKSLGYLQ